MAWDGPADAPPTARIVTLAPSLQKTERRVTELIASDPMRAVECTAQQLAETAGVGRASVIRTAQSLGYDGYPQLRVALAQELAQRTAATDRAISDGTMQGALRSSVERFASRLSHAVSALTEQALNEVVRSLDEAARVLVIANGLSAPLGMDLTLRLTSAGRPAELIQDAIGQQIAARQLGQGSTCVVISGSGANRTTLDAIRAAREGGASVIAITSFARSTVVELADVALVVPPVNDGFRDELVQTSRAALMLVIENLVELLVISRGERGVAAQAAMLEVVGRAIAE
ncbi:MAG: MurR/RpiR family transcriptional regulator [Microbacterium sp.]